MKKLVKGLFVLVIMFISICALSTVETDYCKSDVDFAKEYMVYNNNYRGFNMDNVKVKITDWSDDEVAFETFKDDELVYHTTISRSYMRNDYKYLMN